MLRGLSLFSGIGGLDLAFEMAGGQVIAQCEIDPFCRRVLAKNWPDKLVYEDVHDVTAERLWGDGLPRPDIVFGGFPCQPHSLAGRRGGSGDDRDLWGECVRVLRNVHPRWAVFENVGGLLSSETGRFFQRVLWDLATLGYDASWCVYGADAVGAPHRRERVFIVGRLCEYDRREVLDERRNVADTSCRAGELQSSEREDLRDQPSVNGSPGAVGAAVAHATGGGGSHEQGSLDRATLGRALVGADGGVEHGAGAPRVQRCIIDDAGGAAGVRGGEGMAHTSSQPTGPGRPQRSEAGQETGLGGAPVAHAQRTGPQRLPWTGEPREGRASGIPARDGAGADLADANTEQWHGGGGAQHGWPEPPDSGSSDLDDAEILRPQAGGIASGTGAHLTGSARAGSDGIGVGQADSDREQMGRIAEPRTERAAGQLESGVGGEPHGLSRWMAGRGLALPSWPAGPGEPQRDDEPPRLATGVKDRSAKLKALGNAVVPLQALPVFQAIMAVQSEHERGKTDGASSPGEERDDV